MPDAAVDTDVLLKGASYRLLPQLSQAVTQGSGTVMALGAATYVVSDRLKKTNIRQDRNTTRAQWTAFISSLSILEPSDAETHLAARLEDAAQRLNAQLDSGESQLCAIAIMRSLPQLITGDKRAIRALSIIGLDTEECHPIFGRVTCLEQLFQRLLVIFPPTDIRSHVCAEPNTDMALTICFGCQNTPSTFTDWQDGLASYVNSLRNDAPDVLTPSDS